MDFLIAVAGLLGILLLYNLIHTQTNQRSKIRAPKLPGAWPIIGHLHLFEYDNPPLCKKLGDMADKYGPVYRLQLGMKNMVVVNCWEAAKDCFTASDAALASRAASAAGKYLAYNYAIFAVSPKGPHWRHFKKLTTFHLTSANGLEMVRHHRASEIKAFIKDLHRLCIVNDQGGSTAPTKVVMCEIFLRLVINVMCRMISGRGAFRSVTANDEEGLFVKRMMVEFNIAQEAPVLSDMFPVSFLEWLDPQGHIKEMKRYSKEFDSLLQNWVDEHRKRRLVDGPGNDDDFIHFIMTAMENGAVPSEYANDKNIKATIAIIFLGGNSTIPICLKWTLSLLLDNEHALNHAQEELDQQVGIDRWVEESDIKSLDYLQATVIEALRLYPPAQLGFPHEAVEDCCIYGYHIPKGTQVLFNIWKVHRDPRVWLEPNKFIPERWLTSQKTFDASKYHYEFITFSRGRRSCAGKPLALQVVHLILARLLQGFNLSRPMNMPIDMGEKHTLLLERASPLEVTIAPRLHPQLYQET